MMKQSIISQFIIAATAICATTTIASLAMGQENDMEVLMKRLGSGQNNPQAMAELFSRLQKNGGTPLPENTVQSPYNIESLRQKIKRQKSDSTARLEAIKEQMQLRERQAYNGMTFQEFHAARKAGEKARIQSFIQHAEKEKQRLLSETQEQRTARRDQELADRQELSVTTAKAEGVILTLTSASKTKGTIKLEEGDKQIGMGAFSCRESSMTLMMTEEGLNYTSEGQTTMVEGATLTRRVVNGLNLTSTACSGNLKNMAFEILGLLCLENLIEQCSPNSGASINNFERDTFIGKDGPTYGNWCGGCWSGGKKACDGTQGGIATPLDSMDEICKQHDICYAGVEQGYVRSEKVCDSDLVYSLKLLDEDPEKWPKPPKKGTEWSAKQYRKAAIGIFK